MQTVRQAQLINSFNEKSTFDNREFEQRAAE